LENVILQEFSKLIVGTKESCGMTVLTNVEISQNPSPEFKFYLSR